MCIVYVYIISLRKKFVNINQIFLKKKMILRWYSKTKRTDRQILAKCCWRFQSKDRNHSRWLACSQCQRRNNWQWHFRKKVAESKCRSHCINIFNSIQSRFWFDLKCSVALHIYKRIQSQDYFDRNSYNNHRSSCRFRKSFFKKFACRRKNIADSS